MDIFLKTKVEIVWGEIFRNKKKTKISCLILFVKIKKKNTVEIKILMLLGGFDWILVNDSSNLRLSNWEIKTFSWMSP